MKLTIDIPQEAIDDLTLLSDFHAVPIDDVVRHYITDGITSEKMQKLGPWEPEDPIVAAFRRLKELAGKLENSLEREPVDMQINGSVRRVK